MDEPFSGSSVAGVIDQHHVAGDGASTLSAKRIVPRARPRDIHDLEGSAWVGAGLEEDNIYGDHRTRPYRRRG